MKHQNKTCAFCSVEKLRTEFYKNCKSPDRLAYYCKDCSNTLAKTLYKSRDRTQEYKARNHSIRGRYNNLKHSSKNRGISINLTEKDYTKIISNPCFYCGGKLGKVIAGSGLDRINNTKGYFPTNLVSCCKLCNMVKGSEFNLIETQLMIKAVLGYRHGQS